MAADELVRRKSEEDQVEILTLAHPPVNALSTALLRELAERFETLAAASPRAVIITGEGQYFSAGADLKEMGTIGFERAPEVIRSSQALYSRIEAFPCPVIAAVNGLALGGALELALACDLRVAGDSAKFGLTEVGFGLMPTYGGTYRLAKLVGRAKAKELIFTGAMVPAAEALRIGLVNKAVPAGQELRAARDLAHTIAKKAPRAVRAAKRVMREGETGTTEAALELERKAFLEEVLPSKDLPEGIAAFLERRPPKFTGE